MKHFNDMFKKAQYLVKSNKVILEIDGVRRQHFKSGDYNVWIDEHGKFNCDCTWGSLHINGLCSHIISVLIYLD